jgi:hypothetical protein
MVKTAGSANRKLMSPKPKDDRSDATRENPDSKNTVEE